MAMYVALHLDPDGPCDIACVHHLNDRRPDGYPVLTIGTLTVFPTRERLERLRAVIDAYLAAHGDKAVSGPAVEARFIVRDGKSVFAKDGRPVLFGDRTEAALAAEIFRPDGPDGSADRAGGPEAESLESMALEEMRSDLTEAAHEVGIDPDGLSDGEVIRALVRRGKRAATGAAVDADELPAGELEAAGRSRPVEVPR